MDEQLKKYFSGQLSEEEKKALFNRILSDPDLKAEFVRFQNAEALSQLAEREGDEEWASAKLDEWKNMLRKKESRSRGLRYRWYVAAAAVLLLLLLPLSLYYSLTSDDISEADRLALYAKQFVPQDAQQQIKVFLSPTQEVEVEGGKASVSYSSLGEVSINEKELEAEASVPDTVAQITQTLPEEAPEFNQIIVPRGKFTNLRLSDGTLIYINSASRIVYPKVFQGDRRRIYIEGEAYLEVAKDKQRPFIVQTSTFEVEVLGTSFNVNAYKDDSRAEVVLLEGSVRLSDQKHPATLLKPDQMAVVNQEGVQEVLQVKAADYISWKDGLLLLHSEKLASVCRRLERFYGCRISISPQAGRYKMRGKIDLCQPVDELLRLISLTAPVQWRKNDGGIYFIEDK